MSNLHFLSGAVTLMAVLLSACGYDKQDRSPYRSHSEYQGVAVDGQIARAKIYLDLNNNKSHDSNENFAFTDNDGFFGTNTITNVNYCDDESSDNYQYCLQSGYDVDEIILRSEGGYDALTGYVFAGDLSALVSVSDNGVVESTVLSPITSMFVAIETSVNSNNTLSETEKQSQIDAQRFFLLGLLDIEETAIETDFLSTATDGSSIDTALLNSAIKVHKTIAVMSDRLVDSYDEMGRTAGLPFDASGYLYENLVTALLAENTRQGGELTLNEALDSRDVIEQALLTTESDIRAAYQALDMTTSLPAERIISESNSAVVDRIIDVTQSIKEVVDRAIPLDGSFTGSQSLRGAVSMVEVVVQQSFDEDTEQVVAEGGENMLDNALSFATDDSNDTLYNALLTSLGSDSANIDNIIATDLSSLDSIETIELQATLPENTIPYSSLPGKQVTLSEPDLGVEGRRDDVEMLIYFHGDEGDTSGSASMCIKFIDDALNAQDLGEDSVEGEYLDTASWSLINVDSLGASYKLILVLDFLGDQYSISVRPNGEQVQIYVDSETQTWDTSEVITAYTAADSDEDCRAWLPLRF